MINIKKIDVDVANQGHITNSYIVYDDNSKAVIIDPGFDSKKIIENIKKLNITVNYIIITHAHADHIGALENIQQYTNAKIIVHKNDFEALVSKAENYCEMLNVSKQNLNQNEIIQVKDGYILKFSNFEFEIIHTPGHTSGSICVYEKNINKLFTGDTLFCDCYGRCDLYSGDFEEMVDSIRKLFDRFEDIEIYPGHDKIVNISTSKRYIKILLAIKGINI